MSCVSGKGPLTAEWRVDGRGGDKAASRETRQVVVAPPGPLAVQWGEVAEVGSLVIDGTGWGN